MKKISGLLQLSHADNFNVEISMCDFPALANIRNPSQNASMLQTTNKRTFRYNVSFSSDDLVFFSHAIKRIKTKRNKGKMKLYLEKKLPVKFFRKRSCMLPKKKKRAIR